LLEKTVEIKAENKDVKRNLERRHYRDYNERKYENPQTIIFYQSFFPKSRGILPESSETTMPVPSRIRKTDKESGYFEGIATFFPSQCPRPILQ